MNGQWFTQSGLCLLLVLGSGLGRVAMGQESREGRAGTVPDYDEDGQLAKLPRLPSGMTVTTIREGDSLFHGKGGCTTCHGVEAEGMPAAGSSLRGGLHFIPYDWHAIDSVIAVGISEPLTRSPVAMPARGAQSNLTPEETRKIAAYIWAISQVRGEPWPGGHQRHEATAGGGAQSTKQPSR